MPIQLTQAAYERKKAGDDRRQAARNAADKALFDSVPAFMGNADRAARLAAAERERAAALVTATTPPAAPPPPTPTAEPTAAPPTVDLSKMTAIEKLALGRKLEQQRQPAGTGAAPATTGIAPPATPPVDFSKMTAIQKLAYGRRLEQEKRRAAAGPTPPPAVDRVAEKLAGMTATEKLLLGLQLRSGHRAG